MAYHPVTDIEWQYLRRRFKGLWGGRADERGTVVRRSEAEIRALFNEGLPGSPVEDDVRKRARAIVHERVRDFSVEAYANPYFELEWDRAVTANPALGQHSSMAEARRLLWEAYYMRDETEARRKYARAQWRKMSDLPGRDDDKIWEDT
jgi:hypothetical protein